MLANLYGDLHVLDQLNAGLEFLTLELPGPVWPDVGLFALDGQHVRGLARESVRASCFANAKTSGTWLETAIDVFGALPPGDREAVLGWFRQVTQTDGSDWSIYSSEFAGARARFIRRGVDILGLDENAGDVFDVFVSAGEAIEAKVRLLRAAGVSESDLALGTGGECVGLGWVDTRACLYAWVARFQQDWRFLSAAMDTRCVAMKIQVQCRESFNSLIRLETVHPGPHEHTQCGAELLWPSDPAQQRLIRLGLWFLSLEAWMPLWDAIGIFVSDQPCVREAAWAALQEDQDLDDFLVRCGEPDGAAIRYWLVRVAAEIGGRWVPLSQHLDAAAQAHRWLGSDPCGFGTHATDIYTLVHWCRDQRSAAQAKYRLLRKRPLSEWDEKVTSSWARLDVLNMPAALIEKYAELYEFRRCWDVIEPVLPTQAIASLRNKGPLPQSIEPQRP